MNWHELLFDFVTLLVTVDPGGTTAVFLALTKDMTPEARRRTAFRAVSIAFLLLAGVLYLGQYLLEIMRIDLPSFQISGGIVLFVFALMMIFDKGLPRTAAVETGHDVAIFPLAMPSIAGPGAMLTVVLLTENNTHSLVQQTMTCGVMMLVLSGTLTLMLLSDRFMALIGRAGASVLSRVMGMILGAVAVQMVYSAVKGQIGPG